jgi:DNA-binding NtrC family response regulator
MRHLRRQVARIAAHDANVLIVGESGSGKERVARALHRLSRRSSKPMIVLNCAALPDSLVESDLFGYERGAFTSAHAAYPGKFSLANGGVLFLDEIGDMPCAMQAKILRIIEGHEYYRIGATQPVRSDVRLIAATHRDLEALCETGQFRHDLYFRLNVARIDVPPLRERVPDIVPLAQQALRELCGGTRRASLTLGAEVRDVLRAYAWPGNVRELRNAVESAMIHADADVVEPHDLPAHIVRWLERTAASPDERTRLESALHHTNWNKSEAARSLKWSRMKLYRKLREYRIGAVHDGG